MFVVSWEEEKEKLGKTLVKEFYRLGLIKTWARDKPEGWKLVSGLWCPFYIQLRPLCSHPQLLEMVGRGVARMVEEEIGEADRLVGLAAAGIPIAVAASLYSGIPACYTRKLVGVKTLGDLEAKMWEYGEHRLVEGVIEDGDRLVLVDDLVTGLDTKMLALEQVRREAVRRGKRVVVEHIAVVVDRRQKGLDLAKGLGVELHSLVPFADKGLPWLKDQLSRLEFETIKNYLEDPTEYQSPEKQLELRKHAFG